MRFYNFSFCRIQVDGTFSVYFVWRKTGSTQYKFGFNSMISWSGLDIGRDRGSPVSHYAAPFEFSGKLFSVTVKLQAQKGLDGKAVGEAEMARQ